MIPCLDGCEISSQFCLLRYSDILVTLQKTRFVRDNDMLTNFIASSACRDTLRRARPFLPSSEKIALQCLVLTQMSTCSVYADRFSKFVHFRSQILYESIHYYANHISKEHLCTERYTETLDTVPKSIVYAPKHIVLSYNTLVL